MGAKKKLKAGDYDLLERMMGSGISKAHAARQLGMSAATLRRILGEDEKAKQHFEWGMGLRETWLWKRLHDTEVKNKASIIYELKSRFGYSDMPRPETQKHTIEIKHFPIPKSRTREEFQQIVDVTPLALPEPAARTEVEVTKGA